MVGLEVAKGDGLDYGTTAVTGYDVISTNGVRAFIWYSPGMQDETDNDGAYITEMKAKCSSYDLVLFCFSMQSVRFSVAVDKSCTKRLTEANLVTG